METKKPRISILDRRFKYRNAANTDVGRHLRAARRAQRAKETAPHGAVPIRKRAAS